MTADEERTGPPTGHPDLDTLADLHAGALDGPEAERVHGHVVGCRLCTDALAAFDAVQGQLRSLPPAPMPAAVAASLDATLADLRRPPSATPGRDPRNGLASTPDGPASTRDPQNAAVGGHDPKDDPARARDPHNGLAPAGAEGELARAGDPEGDRAPGRDPEDELALARFRRGRRLSRALGAVAAAVAVIAAAGAVTAIVRAGSGSSDTASGAAGGAASAPLVPEESGGRVGPDADNGAGTGAGGGQAAIPAYDRAGLRAALPEIAGRGTSAGAATLDPARQTACAGSIAGATGSLRGVERILYQGRPAYVFVFADGGRLTGYVVTEACGSAAGLPATVLDTVS